MTRKIFILFLKLQLYFLSRKPEMTYFFLSLCLSHYLRAKMCLIVQQMECFFIQMVRRVFTDSENAVRKVLSFI